MNISRFLQRFQGRQYQAVEIIHLNVVSLHNFQGRRIIVNRIFRQATGSHAFRIRRGGGKYQLGTARLRAGRLLRLGDKGDSHHADKAADSEADGVSCFHILDVSDDSR